MAHNAGFTRSWWCDAQWNLSSSLKPRFWRTINLPRAPADERKMHFTCARGGSPGARGRARDPTKWSRAQLVNLVVCSSRLVNFWHFKFFINTIGICVFFKPAWTIADKILLHKFYINGKLYSVSFTVAYDFSLAFSFSRYLFPSLVHVFRVL